MKEFIILCGRKVEYKIKISPNARCIRICILPNGILNAVIPQGFSEDTAEDFIRKKADWILKKIKFFKKATVLSSCPLKRLKIHDHKQSARIFISERLDYYTKKYNFSYNCLNIKAHLHRWGSCSSHRNLNFNYRIIMLPLELADYIIVHELCHLKEMNHSSKFWKLVEEIIPDYRERRKKLKYIIF